jgi:hypothetical protein
MGEGLGPNKDPPVQKALKLELRRYFLLRVVLT